MNKPWLIAGALLLSLSACGDDAAPANQAEEAPPTPVAGLYKVNAETTVVQPADKGKPRTTAKVGDKQTVDSCVAADGSFDPSLFAEKGDRCTARGTHLSGGIISLQYDCKRGSEGVTLNVAGEYGKDKFEVLVNSATGFRGDGDYTLTRHLVAKRVGNCPAKA
ncbi:DUF3617 family protein [Sphingomonas sp. ASV193]|uniref:DUF3617 domain-containing protein n=1 Tax=Sphingomonas sp. ASV193 TaxID=3144405 RepID=UPI0032E90827